MAEQFPSRLTMSQMVPSVPPRSGTTGFSSLLGSEDQIVRCGDHLTTARVFRGFREPVLPPTQVSGRSSSSERTLSVLSVRGREPRRPFRSSESIPVLSSRSWRQWCTPLPL